MSELQASLKLSVVQQGLDNISHLIRELKGAGVATEAFEAQAAALSAELAQLSRDRGLIEQFRGIKEATTGAEQAMRGAATAATESAQALRARQSELASLAAAEQEAAKAVESARTRHAELAASVKTAAAELKQLREAQRGAGDAANTYTERIAETRTRLAGLRADARNAATSVTELAHAHKRSVEATREATAQVSAAEKTFTRLREEAARTKTAYEEQRLALHNTRKALAEAGMDISRLAEHQRRLAQAQTDVTTRSQQLAQTMTAAATGTRKLGTELQQVAAEFKKVDTHTDALQAKLKGVAAAMGGLFAASRIKGAALDVIEIADAYGQYASRIEQATASAAEYQRVQRRLLDTASNTYRPLAEAQELYIRTADSLRALGYNTEAALDVTDSFSYLMVTNAAAADKAASAIDAYSKALQAGKLDVDGWMSMMAATPTIVDAIASATGKSADEIRRLGATGKLAVADLNEGLRQSVEANKALADSMPTTVADAIQKLANNWSVYVGEANRANGATANIASMIETLADNLEEVISVAQKAGDVMLAAFGARALMAVKNYASALTASIAATQGATAAQARLGAAAAGAASGLNAATAATAAQAAAATAATRANTGYLAALGKLRGIGSALKFTGWMAAATVVMELGQRLLFAKSAAEQAAEAVESVIAAADFSDRDGLLAFDQQMRDVAASAELAGEQIAEALGERLRKLSETELQQLRTDLVQLFEDGARATPALTGALQAVEAQLDALAEKARWARPMLDEAELARFKLAEVQKLFQSIGSDAKGAAKSVADALQTLVSAADISSVDGIRKLADDLALVEKSAYAAGNEIDAALRQRLAQLSGKELQEFRIQAEMALGSTAEKAQQLARINEQILQVSFTKLGVNAAAALGQISPAAQDVIDTLDGLVTALDQAQVGATEAGRAIEMALTNAFAAADSLPAIEALETRMRALAEAGKLGAEGLARLESAAADARARIEDLLPGVQSIEEAFRNLGIQSQAELDKLAAKAKESFDFIREAGSATPRELQEAFKNYAEAAIAANDGVADAALKAQAAQYDLKIEADAAGKSIVRSMSEAADATKKVGDASEKAAEKVEAIANEVRDLVAETRAHNAAVGGIRQSWIDAEVAASAYAAGAAEAGRREYERWKNTRGALDRARAAARSYVSAMEALDAQQQRMSSNGVRSLEDLQLQWLELTATEEEIFRARQVRERMEYQRQLEMTKLAAQRAAKEGDTAEYARLQDEIRLMQQSLDLLDKIQAKQTEQFKAAARERKEAEREREREARNAARRARQEEAAAAVPEAPPPATPQPAAPLHIHIEGVLDVNDPVTLDRLGRKLRPVFADLTRKGVS